MANTYLDDDEAQRLATLQSTGLTPEDYLKLGQIPDHGQQSDTPADVVDPAPDLPQVDEAPAPEMPHAAVEPDVTKTKDPLASIREQAIRDLIKAKYPDKGADSGLLSERGAGKASLAFYRAGGGKSLSEGFFTPEDPSKDALKKATFEVDRAKALSSLMGKSQSTKDGESADAYRAYIVSTDPTLARSMGPAFLTADRKTLESAANLKYKAEHDADTHKAADAKPEAATTAYDRSLEKLGKTQEFSIGQQGRSIAAAKDRANIAATDRDMKEGAKAAEPIAASKSIRDQLQVQLDKYGDKIPGLGPVEGNIPEAILGPAQTIGAALGRSASNDTSADEGRKNRMLAGQLLVDTEREKGGVRAVSNAQAQARLSEAIGLIKTGTPSNLRQALAIRAEVDRMLANTAKTAHPRAAGAIDNLIQGGDATGLDTAQPVSEQEASAALGPSAGAKLAGSVPTTIKVPPPFRMHLNGKIYVRQPDGHYEAE